MPPRLSRPNRAPREKEKRGVASLERFGRASSGILSGWALPLHRDRALFVRSRRGQDLLLSLELGGFTHLLGLRRGLRIFGRLRLLGWLIGVHLMSRPLSSQTGRRLRQKAGFRPATQPCALHLG